MLQRAPIFIRSCAVLGGTAALLLGLSGCAGFDRTVASAPTVQTVTSISGSINGGQQPIIGSRVYLYAANTTANGGAAISLMTPGAPGTSTDGHGVAYVTTTGPNGTFSYGGTYTNCSPGKQIYLLAVGGVANGVSGPSNDAITLAAPLGDCANLTPSTVTIVNEVTTVAAAYALRGFMVDPTRVGTNGNLTGLKNAFATANNLVDVSTGKARSTTPGSPSNGVAPQQSVNTLGNIIASCVNSASGSAACTTLFNNTTLPGVNVPTDTLSALLNVAAQPGFQTGNLFGLASGVAPFQPALASQPNDFALGITYTPTGITGAQPGPVVIDGSGNVWTANCQSCVTPTAVDTLLEFSPSGALLHSYKGNATVGAGVLHNIQGIALDSTSTYIYTLNQAVPGSTFTTDQLVKMSTSTGLVQSGFPVTFSSGTYGTNAFTGLAFDNSGEIWATAGTAGAIVELDPVGNTINGGPYFVGGTAGVATDNIGNIWFAGVGGNNLLQFDTNGDFLNNFTPTGLNQPVNVTVDASNNLWLLNAASHTLSKLNFFNGSNSGGSPFSLNLNLATSSAIDGNNQLFVPNCRVSCPGSGSTSPDNLLRIISSGAINTGGSGANAGIQSPAFNGATGVAIDPSGNVWVSNKVSGTLTQVVGFGAPTIQPLATASARGAIGQLP